jgi:hypothetical protein
MKIKFKLTKKFNWIKIIINIYVFLCLIMQFTTESSYYNFGFNNMRCFVKKMYSKKNC